MKLLRKAGADCELGPDENAALHFAVRGGSSMEGFSLLSSSYVVYW